MKKFEKLEKPIIFIGTGRSGTTIISEIMHRHPDLAFPSNYQKKYPANSKINLVRLLFDNPLWRIIGQKPQLNEVSDINRYLFKSSEAYKMWDYLSGESIDFSRGFLNEETLSEDRINFIRSYFNKMVVFQNRNRLSFKITGPSRISFLLKIFPDAIFINLKRNLIPTINSFLKIDFWQSRGARQLWWNGVYDENEKDWAEKNSNNPILMTAFQLIKINEISELERNQFKPKYLEINYEDFVDNPKQELKRIMSFTELSPFDIDKHLNKVTIYNRNKKDSDYFGQEDLEKIHKLQH